MKTLTRRAALGTAIAAAFARPAPAQEAGPIRITAPWTRAAGANGTGAGFLTLRNTGTTPDRLVAVRAGFARSVELHTHIRAGDVMRMRQVPAIDLAPGAEVRLQPGGFHIMLIGLDAALRQGSRVPVTLVFERAGEVEVQLAVESAGARGPGAGGHHH
jgi:copper(I)-binding protein